jgi:DNA-binding MarR family transcriptional regulator
LSSKQAHREVLQERIVRTIGRDLSEQMVHYHQAIAERLGLNMSDHKALDMVCTEGSLTAGQLAERTNLTSGAVTGLVDRLEQAGFVRRERDPYDRRRVIIQPNSEVQSLAAISNSFARALTEVCSRYTEEELATILNFTTALVTVLEAETAELESTLRNNP